MFGSKGKEVAGGWRRIHNEELHKLLHQILSGWSNQRGCDGHGL